MGEQSTLSLRTMADVDEVPVAVANGVEVKGEEVPEPPSAPVVRCETQVIDNGGEGGVGENGEKMDGSKWGKVDTSYIDWRTADPDRLEPRRDAVDDQPPIGSSCVGPSKSEDGKWNQVDVSYINHRTAVVENLDGRRAVTRAGSVENMSATVKKEGDGKWKVDTSYIGYRTGDPDNLTRKEGERNLASYADPADTKYPYQDLKGEALPDDVDPARKECYLSDEEFETVFGFSVAEFAKMPKWKQQNAKRANDLF